ncbi:MAG: urease accessory protein UreD [Spongiibacteraceae bacterium]
MTANWRAQLDVRFAAQKQRTVLVERMHSGPLVVQKPLYPEGDGICHAVIVHPPGGIAGGDELHLHVNLDEGAHALLTTPGAGKWYKANGRDAAQHLRFKVSAGATLEWLPQETILFDAARVRMSARVELAADAKFAGWEMLCFGRRAAGEKFAQGHLQQHVQIWRDDELLWNEAANLEAGSRAMLSPVGLNGHTISAVFLVAAGAVPADILEACRAIVPVEKVGQANNGYGVTALPGIFAARFIGDNIEQARMYFEQLWHVLRPWYASVDTQRPRIWST